MQNTIEAIIKNGQIIPLESVELEEGSRALVTILSEKDDKEFWLSAGENSLNEIWANDEDDIYAELLAK
jgi:predicted DNA-binding antitoxin AbrB/MazE fold protein